MDVATVVNLVVAVTGLVAAVTALVHSLRTKRQLNSHVNGGPGQ